MQKPVLILASNSPRRRQLLALTGRDFLVRPSDVDETPLPGEPPERYTLRLAEDKARLAAGYVPAEAWIIASDTTVALDGRILGKPEDAAEARAMLTALRGREHDVYTAVALYQPASGRLLSEVCHTGVTMRAYTDAEMEAYIATGDPMDKAGAYGIQHAGFSCVAALDGCYASVMGFPLCHLERLMRRIGLGAEVDVPSACQRFLAYDCPVFHFILQDPASGGEASSS
jgi:MAF protein